MVAFLISLMIVPIPSLNSSQGLRAFFYRASSCLFFSARCFPVPLRLFFFSFSPFCGILFLSGPLSCSCRVFASPYNYRLPCSFADVFSPASRNKFPFPFILTERSPPPPPSTLFLQTCFLDLWLEASVVFFFFRLFSAFSIFPYAALYGASWRFHKTFSELFFCLRYIFFLNCLVSLPPVLSFSQTRFLGFPSIFELFQAFFSRFHPAAATIPIEVSGLSFGFESFFSGPSFMRRFLPEVVFFEWSPVLALFSMKIFPDSRIF